MPILTDRRTVTAPAGTVPAGTVPAINGNLITTAVTAATTTPPADPVALRAWVNDTLRTQGLGYRFPAEIWATPGVKEAVFAARDAQNGGFDARPGNANRPHAPTTPARASDDMTDLKARLALEKNLAPDARVRSPYAALNRGEVQLVSANLENMFNPADDPNTDDREMTPEGSGGRYTSEDYEQHRKAFELQFRALNAGSGPGIIGTVEMEGLQVANDMNEQNFSGMGFTAIERESSSPDVKLDPRGIRNGAFSKYPLWPGTEVELITVPGLSGQRGVLLMQLDMEGQRVVVAVNHWKSMRPLSELPPGTPAPADPAQLRKLLGELGETTSARQNGQIAAALKARLVQLNGGPVELLDATSYIDVRGKQGAPHPLLPKGSHGDDFLDRVIVNQAAGLIPESVVAIGESRHALTKENDYQGGLMSDHKALSFIVKPDAARGLGIILIGDFNTKYYEGDGSAINTVLGATRAPGAAPANN